VADKTVLLEVQDRVAVVTLNRPDKLNAFVQDMRVELMAALDDAFGRRELRAVILTGAGRAFCSGQDLGERAASMKESAEGPDLGQSLGTYYNPMIRMIRTTAMPVIAAVNGVAAGAGANLALACDIVVAAKSAKFVQSFSKIGLIPDAGGTYILPRLVGRARAMGLALLGDMIDAETAANWGLIWKCVDDMALMPEAQAIAKQLCEGPAQALASIKRALNESPNNSLDRQLDLERDLQKVLGKSPDYREGVMAFTEKRKPKFR
jgi:2-(1,2-epoxy-1,2-dihydrophenyl)acetyl-CoA isomerase